MATASLPQSNDNFSWGLTALRLVRECWAASVELFLHRNFGPRYLAAWSGGGILLIPIYGFFWMGHDLRPLSAFYLIYVGMFVYARVAGLLRWWRGGAEEHSFYTGTPRLAKYFPKLREQTIKHYVEPLLLIGLAYLVGNHNPPFCFYLIGAAICLFFRVDLAVADQRRRAMEMHDAVIDQRHVTERFREMQNQS
ncbi:MAG: hypothetical protein JNK76_20785 [Planctomycetales bacterium]|nr:hypothetical protein [Planctomycetales bacterium]